MPEAKFERRKPHVNIGTIGHASHGKTTLTAAISKFLADKYPGLNEKRDLVDIDLSLGDRQRGMITEVSFIEYETARRHYLHMDAPGQADYVKSMIAGAAQLDGAILAISAIEGPMAQTREHVMLARQRGISQVIVALTKADLLWDDEMLELVEMEVRELLSSQGFDGDKTPVIPVSARKALEGDPKWVSHMEDLVSAIDNYLMEPALEFDKPFLMPIDDVFTIIGRGTVVTGRAERGTLVINSEVEIIGIRPLQRSVVTGIEMFHKQLDEAWSGENCGLLLQGVAPDDVERGQVVVAPGSVTPHSSFEANVYMLSREEGGRHNPVYSGYSPTFYFRTVEVGGTVILRENVEQVMPGETSEVSVELFQPTAIEDGLHFAIREGGRTVGSGRIIKVMVRSLLELPSHENMRSSDQGRIGEASAERLIECLTYLRDFHVCHARFAVIKDASGNVTLSPWGIVSAGIDISLIFLQPNVLSSKSGPIDIHKIIFDLWKPFFLDQELIAEIYPVVDLCSTFLCVFVSLDYPTKDENHFLESNSLKVLDKVNQMDSLYWAKAMSSAQDLISDLNLSINSSDNNVLRMRDSLFPILNLDLGQHSSIFIGNSRVESEPRNYSDSKSDFDSETPRKALDIAPTDLTVRQMYLRELLDPEADSTAHDFAKQEVLYVTHRKFDRNVQSYSYGVDEFHHYGKATLSGNRESRFAKVLSTATVVERFFGFDPRIEILELQSSESFYSELSSIHLGNQNDKRTLVYLHGFNTPFNDSVKVAAQFAEDLKYSGVVIAYSWPSFGNIFRYGGDKLRATGSVRYFLNFLSELTKSVGSVQIDLIVHSMGNRIMLDCIDALSKSNAMKDHRFGNVIFAAPDVSSERFISVMQTCSGEFKSSTLYVSRKDLALRTSCFINRSNRAGLTPPVTVVDGVDTIQVSRSDGSLIGHNYYNSSPSMIYDISAIFKGELDPRIRTRVRPKRDHWYLY